MGAEGGRARTPPCGSGLRFAPLWRSPIVPRPHGSDTHFRQIATWKRCLYAHFRRTCTGFVHHSILIPISSPNPHDPRCTPGGCFYSGGFLAGAASTSQRSWIGEPGRGRRMGHGYMVFHRRARLRRRRGRRPLRVPKSALRKPLHSLCRGAPQSELPTGLWRVCGGTPPPRPTCRVAPPAVPLLWACRPPHGHGCARSRRWSEAAAGRPGRELCCRVATSTTPAAARGLTSTEGGVCASRLLVLKRVPACRLQPIKRVVAPRRVEGGILPAAPHLARVW